MIPYSGTLYSKGKPVSQGDAVQMAFALYSDVSALPSLANNPSTETSRFVPHAGRKWTSWSTTEGIDALVSSTSENTVGVYVRKGRFLAHLGDQGQEVLNNDVFDSGPLYEFIWIIKSQENNE